MAAPKKTKSWMSTLPGVLTAIAGVITAVTGLAVALHQTGPDKRTPYQAAVTTTTNNKPSSPRIGRANNSNYKVGLVTLGMSDDEFDQIMAKILSAGFSKHQNSAPYLDRQPWLAPTSTVFYYGDSSRPKAQELAKFLEGIIGKDFQVTRGAGLGVDNSERDITLVVHVISK